MALPSMAPLALDPPPRGGSTMPHDPTFMAWDAAFSTLRDTVNRGIDVINKAGAGLGRLPEGSLEQLLIHPLTGDYGAIAQNATACHTVRDGAHTWGDNVLRLSVGVEPGWGGQAAAAYLVRINTLALAVRGIGELISQGSVVFTTIADFSERLGIRVEKLVVQLGKVLARLAQRLLSKVAGPAGWAAFAFELVTKGLDVITDIIDDVQLVLSLIEVLRDLQGEVRTWVAEQRARLQLFRELPGLLT